MNLRRLAWPGAILALVVAIVGFAWSLKSAQGEDFTKGVGIDQKLGSQVPLDLAFKDENGNEVKLADYFGKRPVLLMFVFYRCEGTCALELAGVTKLFKDMKLERIGEDYEVVTVSIHPKETPDLAATKKRAYLTMVKDPAAERAWHFLTGDEKAVRKLTDSVGYRYVYEEAKDRIVHPTGIMFLSPEGKVAQYLYGVEYPAKMAVNALATARENKTGIVAAVLDFDCFQRDAQTGKVRINVMNATKVVGLATLLILVVSIVVMTRKDRDSMGGGAPGQSA